MPPIVNRFNLVVFSSSFSRRRMCEQPKAANEIEAGSADALGTFVVAAVVALVL